MDVIRYRTVVNDAVVSEWELMPEIKSPDLDGLIEYLKTCPGWDYRLLSLKHQGFDKHQVSYGNRALFYLPIIPRSKDFTWLLTPEQIYELVKPCKLCNEKPTVNTEYYTMIGEKEHTVLTCDCGLSLGVFKPVFLYPLDAINKWNKIHS